MSAGTRGKSSIASEHRFWAVRVLCLLECLCLQTFAVNRQAAFTAQPASDSARAHLSQVVNEQRQTDHTLVVIRTRTTFVTSVSTLHRLLFCVYVCNVLSRGHLCLHSNSRSALFPCKHVRASHRRRQTLSAVIINGILRASHRCANGIPFVDLLRARFLHIPMRHMQRIRPDECKKSTIKSMKADQNKI